MKVESRVLVDLMKQAQNKRFKDNKISALVYKARIKKYKERLREIKGQLPVYKARLDKLMRKK